MSDINMDHFKKERTFVIIKPDGVQRSLIGEVIKRFERIGLKLIGLKMAVVDNDMARKHYTLDPEWIRKTGAKAIKGTFTDRGLPSPYKDDIEAGEQVLSWLTKYITSGPVVMMAWEGAHAVGIVRKLVGGTEPLTCDVGTIRGDFVLDSYRMADTDKRAVRNTIHASGSVEEATQELNLWFKPEEMINYRLIQDAILYDVNLDGILE
jgi:nucleoside-diphosphate kinase